MMTPLMRVRPVPGPDGHLGKGRAKAVAEFPAHHDFGLRLDDPIWGWHGLSSCLLDDRWRQTPHRQRSRQT